MSLDAECHVFIILSVNTQCHTECCCHYTVAVILLSGVILIANMVSVFMPFVIILSVNILIVVMPVVLLCVSMLSAVMVSVYADCHYVECCYADF